MTLKHIAWQSLRRRKAKALFVLLGLSIGVATMVALVGLAEALTEEINHKLEKYGANMIITPRSERLSLAYEGLSLGGFSFETSELREEDLERIKTIKNASNVAAVGPMVLGPVKVHDQDVLLAGLKFKATKILKPWWKIDGEQPGSAEVVAGANAARVLGLARGNEIDIGGRRLRVSGVLASTGSQDDDLIFTTLPEAQAILGKPGRVSMVEVAALCIHCPVDDMVKQIAAVLPGASVMAIQAVVKGRMETLNMFKKVSMGGSVLLFLVGGLVVLVTMMGSVKERTGEIGIFRAIGFRKSHVARVVLMEAGLLSALGGVLGYLIGLAAGVISLPYLAGGSNAHLTLNPVLAGGALVMALVLGLGSSIYPAMMAARLDPHQALHSI